MIASTQVLLVTGGSRGIGAATCRLAAKAGMQIAVNYRNDRVAADQILADVLHEGVSAMTVQADVSRADEVEAMFDNVESRLGPVTALVNSAGVEGNNRAIADFDTEILQRLMATNVLGTMYCCQQAARRMSQPLGRGGAIVNVSSMAAVIGGRAGNSDYAASKAAIDTFTLGMSKELAHRGVRVNSIRPGMTASDMTARLEADADLKRNIESSIAMQRIAHADEIAKPILWLLSEEASFISGACLDASGGGFIVGQRLAE